MVFQMISTYALKALQAGLPRLQPITTVMAAKIHQQKIPMMITMEYLMETICVQRGPLAGLRIQPMITIPMGVKTIHRLTQMMITMVFLTRSMTARKETLIGLQAQALTTILMVVKIPSKTSMTTTTPF